jgi:hypothetical protein
MEARKMLDMVLPLDAYAESEMPIVMESPSTTQIVWVHSKGTFEKTDIVYNTSEGEDYIIQRYLTQDVLEIQEKLRTKWSIALVEAKKLENLYPDPVQGMIDLLSEIPGDYDSWREIIEEPYG